MTRPTSYPEWASSPTPADVVDPGASRKSTGWTLIGGVPEKPPYQTFNWWQQSVYNWIAYLGGISEGALSTLTIAAGAIVPVNASHLVETTGGGASSNLTNITTTNVGEGRTLAIRAADTTHTVVLKHEAGGAGQLHLADGLDCSMDTSQLWVVFIRIGADWYEQYRSTGPSNIVPDATNVRTLGATGKDFSEIHGRSLDGTGTLVIGGKAETTQIDIGHAGIPVNFYGSLNTVYTTASYVAGAIEFAGVVTVSNATDAAVGGTGAIVCAGGIRVAKTIYCVTSVTTPIVVAPSTLTFKVSTSTTAATFDANGFITCPSTAGNHTFGTAGTSAYSTGLIVQGGDTGGAIVYLYAGTLNFAFRCLGSGGNGGALSIDNGNAVFNMAKCTQGGVWTFPSAGRHTFGATGIDTGLEVFTGASNLGIRINANAAPTLSFYTSNTGDAQIRNFGIVNNYNANGALDFTVSDAQGGAVFGTGSTVIGRIQMATGVASWNFGVSAQAGSHLFHGYISANAGGTSGTATTQHPYLACKTIKGTLDASGDLDIAHGISSSAKARIAYVVCKFASGSNWASFSDSVPYSITWDDTNIIFRSTLTAVAIEFFAYYEAA
jgi:hypothetical protein